MHEIPRISVVIPVRNGKKTIVAALESVLSQTVPCYEIIVVDDGSSDGTREVLSQFPDVQVVDGPQAGAGPARNVGTKLASGEFIAFLDADDVWHPTKIQKQLRYIGEDRVVGTYARFVTGKQNRVVGTSIRTDNDVQATVLVKTSAALPCMLSTWIFPKKLLSTYGEFDEKFRLAQDFEIATRWANMGVAFKIVREPLIDYRLHEFSETSQEYLHQYLTAEFVRRKLPSTLESWLENPDKSSLRRGTAGYWFRKSLVAWGDGKIVETAFGLVKSVILDPKSFWIKLRVQGPRMRDFF